MLPGTRVRAAVGKFICLGVCTLFTYVNVLHGAAEMGAALWKERKEAAKKLSVEVEVSGPTLLARLPEAVPSVLPNLRAPSFNTGLPTSLTHHLPQGFTLPLAFTNFKRSNIPPDWKPGDPIILHIQDVHRNQEAQRNIGSSIQELIDRGQADLVALEGAFGPVDVSRFRAFEDQKAVRIAADFLLKEGKLSGAMRTAMTRPQAIPAFIGVDDKDLYDAHVQAYKDSAAQAPEHKARLTALESALSLEKEEVLSPALLALDQKIALHRKGQTQIGEYVKALADGRTALFPQIVLFLKALALEQGLDFQQVEKERSAMLRALLKELDKNQTANLVNLTLAYRLGKVRHMDFYARLKGLCEISGVPCEDYPSMAAYLNYVLVSDQINAEKFMKEVAELESRKIEELAKSREEKDVMARSRRLYLTGKLLDFALTPEEWKEYEASPQESSTDLATFESFFRHASLRDKSMTDSLLKAMAGKKPGITVLVAGGYHSTGMEKLLSQKNIAVITLAPKITRIEGAAGTEYLSVFTQGKTPLEKLFDGDKLFVTPPLDTPGVRRDMASLAGAGAPELLNGPAEDVPSPVERARVLSLAGDGSDFTATARDIEGGVLLEPANSQAVVPCKLTGSAEEGFTARQILRTRPRLSIGNLKSLGRWAFRPAWGARAAAAVAAISIGFFLGHLGLDLTPIFAYLTPAAPSPHNPVFLAGMAGLFAAAFYFFKGGDLDFAISAFKGSRGHISPRAIHSLLRQPLFMGRARRNNPFNGGRGRPRKNSIGMDRDEHDTMMRERNLHEYIKAEDRGRMALALLKDNVRGVLSNAFKNLKASPYYIHQAAAEIIHGLRYQKIRRLEDLYRLKTLIGKNGAAQALIRHLFLITNDLPQGEHAGKPVSYEEAWARTQINHARNLVSQAARLIGERREALLNQARSEAQPLVQETRFPSIRKDAAKLLSKIGPAAPAAPVEPPAAAPAPAQASPPEDIPKTPLAQAEAFRRQANNLWQVEPRRFGEHAEALLQSANAFFEANKPEEALEALEMAEAAVGSSSVGTDRFTRIMTDIALLRTKIIGADPTPPPARSPPRETREVETPPVPSEVLNTEQMWQRAKEADDRDDLEAAIPLARQAGMAANIILNRMREKQGRDMDPAIEKKLLAIFYAALSLTDKEMPPDVMAIEKKWKEARAAAAAEDFQTAARLATEVYVEANDMLQDGKAPLERNVKDRLTFLFNKGINLKVDINSRNNQGSPLTAIFTRNHAWELLTAGISGSMLAAFWLFGWPASVAVFAAWVLKAAVVLPVARHYKIRNKKPYSLRDLVAENLVAWWWESFRLTWIGLHMGWRSREEKVKKFIMKEHPPTSGEVSWELRRKAGSIAKCAPWVIVLGIFISLMGADLQSFAGWDAASLNNQLKLRFLTFAGPPALLHFAYHFIRHELLHNLSSPHSLTSSRQTPARAKEPGSFAFSLIGAIFPGAALGGAMAGSFLGFLPDPYSISLVFRWAAFGIFSFLAARVIYAIYKRAKPAKKVTGRARFKKRSTGTIMTRRDWILGVLGVSAYAASRTLRVFFGETQRFFTVYVLHFGRNEFDDIRGHLEKVLGRTKTDAGGRPKLVLTIEDLANPNAFYENLPADIKENRTALEILNDPSIPTAILENAYAETSRQRNLRMDALNQAIGDTAGRRQLAIPFWRGGENQEFFEPLFNWAIDNGVELRYETIQFAAWKTGIQAGTTNVLTRNIILRADPVGFWNGFREAARTLGRGYRLRDQDAVEGAARLLGEPERSEWNVVRVIGGAHSVNFPLVKSRYSNSLEMNPEIRDSMASDFAVMLDNGSFDALSEAEQEAVEALELISSVLVALANRDVFVERIQGVAAKILGNVRSKGGVRQIMNDEILFSQDIRGTLQQYSTVPHAVASQFVLKGYITPEEINAIVRPQFRISRNHTETPHVAAVRGPKSYSRRALLSRMDPSGVFLIGAAAQSRSSQAALGPGSYFYFGVLTAVISGALAGQSVLLGNYFYDMFLVILFLVASLGAPFGLSFVFYTQGERVIKLGKFLLGLGSGGMAALGILTLIGLVPTLLEAEPLGLIAAALAASGWALSRAGQPPQERGWLSALGHLSLALVIFNAALLCMMALNFLNVPTAFTPSWEMARDVEDGFLGIVIRCLRVAESISPSNWLWMNEIQIEYFGALFALAPSLAMGLLIVAGGAFLWALPGFFRGLRLTRPAKVFTLSMLLGILPAQLAHSLDPVPLFRKPPVEIRVMNLAGERGERTREALDSLRVEHIEAVRGVAGLEGARSSNTNQVEEMDIDTGRGLIRVPEQISSEKTGGSIAHSVGESLYERLSDADKDEWRRLHEESVEAFKQEGGSPDLYFAPDFTKYLKKLDEEDFHTLAEAYSTSSYSLMQQALRGHPVLFRKWAFIASRFYVIEQDGGRFLWLSPRDGTPAPLPDGPLTPEFLRRVLEAAGIIAMAAGQRKPSKKKTRAPSGPASSGGRKIIMEPEYQLIPKKGGGMAQDSTYELEESKGIIARYQLFFSRFLGKGLGNWVGTVWGRQWVRMKVAPREERDQLMEIAGCVWNGDWKGAAESAAQFLGGHSAYRKKPETWRQTLRSGTLNLGVGMSVGATLAAYVVGLALEFILSLPVRAMGWLIVQGDGSMVMRGPPDGFLAVPLASFFNRVHHTVHNLVFPMFALTQNSPSGEDRPRETDLLRMSPDLDAIRHYSQLIETGKDADNNRKLLQYRVEKLLAGIKSAVRNPLQRWQDLDNSLRTMLLDEDLEDMTYEDVMEFYFEPFIRSNEGRILIGFSGTAAGGKSTLADKAVETLPAQFSHCKVRPLYFDDFLRQREDRNPPDTQDPHRKFDVLRYVAFMRGLAANARVTKPMYDQTSKGQLRFGLDADGNVVIFNGSRKTVIHVQQDGTFSYDPALESGIISGSTKIRVTRENGRRLRVLIRDSKFEIFSEGRRIQLAIPGEEPLDLARGAQAEALEVWDPVGESEKEIVVGDGILLLESDKWQRTADVNVGFSIRRRRAGQRSLARKRGRPEIEAEVRAFTERQFTEEATIDQLDARAKKARGMRKKEASHFQINNLTLPEHIVRNDSYRTTRLKHVHFFRRNGIDLSGILAAIDEIGLRTLISWVEETIEQRQAENRPFTHPAGFPGEKPLGLDEAFERYWAGRYVTLELGEFLLLKFEMSPGVRAGDLSMKARGNLERLFERTLGIFATGQVINLEDGLKKTVAVRRFERSPGGNTEARIASVDIHHALVMNQLPFMEGFLNRLADEIVELESRSNYFRAREKRDEAESWIAAFFAVQRKFWEMGIIDTAPDMARRYGIGFFHGRQVPQALAPSSLHLDDDAIKEYGRISLAKDAAVPAPYESHYSTLKGFQRQYAANCDTGENYLAHIPEMFRPVFVEFVRREVPETSDELVRRIKFGGRWDDAKKAGTEGQYRNMSVSAVVIDDATA